MTQDEIAVMDGGKCILQVRGVRPFFSDKFDITKHPKYKYLSDADPKNAFDMEKHIKRRPAIVKPDEVFDYYEIDAAEFHKVLRSAYSGGTWGGSMISLWVTSFL